MSDYEPCPERHSFTGIWCCRERGHQGWHEGTDDTNVIRWDYS